MAYNNRPIKPDLVLIYRITGWWNHEAGSLPAFQLGGAEPKAGACLPNDGKRRGKTETGQTSVFRFPSSDFYRIKNLFISIMYNSFNACHTFRPSFFCPLLLLFLLVMTTLPSYSFIKDGKTMAALDTPREENYYQIIDLPIPDDITLEVGGMDIMPDGNLAVCTRRGEVWIISNPYQLNGKVPQFSRFAHGLHEPLGLNYKNGAFYINQRPELTKLKDQNNDGVADSYQTIVNWEMSGNYHEYSYGPLFLPNGDMLVTLNLAWIGHGASLSKWDGWMLQITPEGEVKPFATGLRSPAGFGFNVQGDIFYTENQGDWVGSGRMTHLEKGDFAGNPEGLKWSHLTGSPIDLNPDSIPDTGKPMHEVAREVPQLKTPSVWFPHSIMGISTSDILMDSTNGKFGPFAGQLFVGDQGQSKIMRVFQEKVHGEYQGACFPFREGFESGVLRMNWGQDGSMFVGMTNRGWSSTGKEPYGIQQLKWTGKTPFEIKEIHAEPDGFTLNFTKPVNKQSAANPDAYNIKSFNYKYHSTYGSPVINQENCEVTGVAVAPDGLSARIKVSGLRQGYIHEIEAGKVLSRKEGKPLLHNKGYYTLKNIPEGKSMLSQKNEPKENNNEVKNTQGEASSKNKTSMPESWTEGPDVTITINTKPGLKYDKTSFEIPAGSKVRLQLNNTDDMLHNLVIVNPGTVKKVAQEAMDLGLDGNKKEYVPQTTDVLYHTSILQPETSETIYFKAPEQPGDYTYVCTYPGHWQSMQGIMKVVR